MKDQLFQIRDKQGNVLEDNIAGLDNAKLYCQVWQRQKKYRYLDIYVKTIIVNPYIQDLESIRR